MKVLLAIIKKEFRRFFFDRRMVLTTLILPGLLIYIVYTAMGSIVNLLASGDDTQTPAIYVQNMSENLSYTLESIFEIREQTVSDEQAKEQIANGDIALLVIFPENFDELTVSTNVPEVSIYYNSSNTLSYTAYTTFVAVLDAYEQSISNVFDINMSADEIYDLADTNSTSAAILSAVFPLVLMTFLFSGCMSVVLEAIAGEKERGTIATLLVTPIKRGQLAFGKIISLSAISVLCGISSFVGLMLSLPNMYSGMGIDISLAAYSIVDYLGMFCILISTSLIFVGLIAIVSAYAKSVKETNSFIAPLMIIVMLCTIGSSLITSPSVGLFFIPVLNSPLCITALLSGTFTVASFLITMCVNLVCAVLLAILLAVMFNSEKIMFNR